MSSIHTLQQSLASLEPQIFFKIRCDFDEEIQRTLICCDSAYYSIDATSISAEFSQEQYSEFSERLFLNFQKTIFAEVVIF